MAILIDSSVWIDWLSRRVDPRPLLEPWVLQRACLTCGIVRVEVIRGVIEGRQRDIVEKLFDEMEDVPLSAGLCAAAARRAWRLDRKGVILPLSDVFIAECAFSAKATLVTTDAHFAHFSDISVRAGVPRPVES